MKYNNKGQKCWSYTYNGTANTYDLLYCLDFINDSTLIAAGSGTYSATSGGFLALAFDSAGNLKTKLEVSSFIHPHDVTISNSSLYFTGTRWDTSGAGTAYDSMKVFRVDYFANTLSIDEFLIRQKLSVFPNPFSQKLNITISDKNPIKRIKLFNSIGRLVYSDIVNDSSLQINCAFLLSGLYLIEVTDSVGNVNRKKLLKTD